MSDGQVYWVCVLVSAGVLLAVWTVLGYLGARVVFPGHRRTLRRLWSDIREVFADADD